MDPSSDVAFYSQPRFVTHIDDHAIIALKKYYDANLPGGLTAREPNDTATKAGKPVRILDICSSWVSHYPPRIVKAAASINAPAEAGLTSADSSQETPSSTLASPVPTPSPIQCFGTGLNGPELAANPALNPTFSGRGRDGEPVAEKRWWVQDLNDNPNLAPPQSVRTLLEISTAQAADQQQSNPTTPLFDATTCVVSIDYLTSPLNVLSSIHKHTIPGGTIHLAISNRCFPTKAVQRWLQITEEERVEMVGDYLWWSGWQEIEIVEVVPKDQGGSRWGLGGWNDPLWIVRARKVEG